MYMYTSVASVPRISGTLASCKIYVSFKKKNAINNWTIEVSINEIKINVNLIIMTLTYRK
jgi:hypothetical protein